MMIDRRLTYFLLFLAIGFILPEMVHSQYFSRDITTHGANSLTPRHMELYKNTVVLIGTAVKKGRRFQGPHYMQLDKEGNPLFNNIISSTRLNGPMMISVDDTYYYVGTPTGDVRDSLVFGALDSNGDSLYQKKILDLTLIEGSLLYEMEYLGDSTLVVMGQFVDNDEFLFIPISLNGELNKDRIKIIDELDNFGINTSMIRDNDGNLSFTYFENILGPIYKGPHHYIVTYDKNWNKIREIELGYARTRGDNRILLDDEAGNFIINLTPPKSVNNNFAPDVPRIIKVDQDGKTLFDTLIVPNNESSNLSVLNMTLARNGDILVYGHQLWLISPLIPLHAGAWIARLSPDGEEKWRRRIYRPRSKVSGNFEDCGFFHAQEDDNGDIYIIGSHLRDTTTRVTDIWLVKLSADGCFDPDDCQPGFSNIYLGNDSAGISTNIMPIVHSASLKCFPNPGIDHVSIDIPDQVNGKITIQVVDFIGKVVSFNTWNAPPSQVSLPLINIPVGAYIIQLTDEHGNTWQERWIKQ